MTGKTGRRRDRHFKTGHLCRFCSGLISWGAILRLIRTDPDTPGYMLNESACHRECLEQKLHSDVALTFPRHWSCGALLDDRDDWEGKPCAFCSKEIAPDVLVRLRVQKPDGLVKRPQFDEQTLPLHFDCLAAVSASRFG